MNLGSILRGIAGFIFGDRLVTGDDNNRDPSDADYTNFNNGLDNLGAKITGSHLTGAEKEANAFSASQAATAFEREAAFSREMFDKETALANTAYQRQVSDMKKAGLNPMLALGAGGSASPSASSVSSAAPSSVTPGSANLGSLLQLFSLPAQLKNIAADTSVKKADAAVKEAETKSIEADTDLTKENTRGSKISNDFNELYNKIRIDLGEMEKKQADKNLKLTESEISENNQWVKESNQRMDLMFEQIENSKDERLTRESMRAMYRANARLANANADTVAIMREADKALKEAQTETEKKKAAELKLSAAYKQGLLDNDYIKALTNDLKASATVKGSQSKLNKQLAEESDIREALLKGDFDKISDRGRLWLWANSL